MKISVKLLKDKESIDHSHGPWTMVYGLWTINQTLHRLQKLMPCDRKAPLWLDRKDLLVIWPTGIHPTYNRIFLQCS